MDHLHKLKSAVSSLFSYSVDLMILNARPRLVAQRSLLDRTEKRVMKPGETIFNEGDLGDALYIVADRIIEVFHEEKPIAELRRGGAFGEMALLNGGIRTATVRAKTEGLLLVIAKKDFDALLAEDPLIAEQIQKLGRDRLVSNLKSEHLEPTRWLNVARESMEHISRAEEYRIQQKAKEGKGASLAIEFGNILDTIPGLSSLALILKDLIVRRSLSSQVCS